MLTKILMPPLSPTMEEGKLAKWHVKEGDAVKPGDILAEIETDKATMGFESVDEGRIEKILIPEGTEGVKVNDPIAVLRVEGVEGVVTSRATSNAALCGADSASQPSLAALLQLEDAALLKHSTLDQLRSLGLDAMAKAFTELEAQESTKGLTHAKWLSLLLDREVSHRREKGLTARLRYAKLSQHATIEDVDYKTHRGLDRGLFLKLADGIFIKERANLLIFGPSGTGKSWLACALGQKACRDNRSVLYSSVPKLLPDLALFRSDGRHAELMRTLARAELLILDDWGLEPFDGPSRRDLLEILDDRHGRKSTLITSPLPVDRWHQMIGDPIYADAILDRLVHNAYRLELSGESLRKKRSQPARKG